MFYKGIIFDLDNTLYDYDLCHTKALEEAFNFIVMNNINLNIDIIKREYTNISKNLKNELNLTASSHNKGIYFKHLLEKLKEDISFVSTINKIYWDVFYKNMACFDGVKEFIIWNKNLGKKIGILTDYETEYQIIKLENLDLLKYVDVVITSEEVGIEKPSIKMFNAILQKMKLHPYEVIMIGDNYEKDVKGALNASILSYWFHETNLEFNCFKKLHSKFVSIYNELEILKVISKYCGERFDLVQAGGGNTSVKINELMFIKASGYNLTNIDESNGYVVMNNITLLEDIKNNSVKDVTEYNFIGSKRGSIESFMHSILKKYTIHLHPIQVNKILISNKAKEIIEEIYPKSLIIDYFTPGIKICNKIKEKYNNENVIFLLNHGLIITHDEIGEIFNLLNDVLDKFELYQKLDFTNYKNTNKISNIINTTFNTYNVSYLSEDILINNFFLERNQLFKEKITFPDALIYCGVEILLSLSDIDEYKNKYNEPPKIITFNNKIYINAHSITKCREIEEVLKSNLMILDNNFNKNYLPLNEICFLNKWDAEKYRKLL